MIRNLEENNTGILIDDTLEADNGKWPGNEREKKRSKVVGTWWN
jgi:hypothetical protein